MGRGGTLVVARGGRGGGTRLMGEGMELWRSRSLGLSCATQSALKRACHKELSPRTHKDLQRAN